MTDIQEERLPYNIILHSFFQTRKGRLIQDKGLDFIGLAMYLYTKSNQVGLFYYSKENIIEDTKVSERKFNLIIRFFEQIDFIHVSEKDALVYIPDMLAFNVQPLTSDSRTKQVRILKAQLSTISDDNEFKIALYKRYKNTHSAIFTKYIEKQVEKEEIEEEVLTPEALVDVYNMATVEKGHTKARLTKLTQKKLKKLIKDGLTRESFANNCITLKFDNIRELIQEIEKKTKLDEIEGMIIDKEDLQNENKKETIEEVNSFCDDIFS